MPFGHASDAKFAALARIQAVAEFTPDGTLLDANASFLRILGRSLDDVRGRRHEILVESTDARDRTETEFWSALARGEAQQGVFPRVGKNGEEVWLQATYAPVVDRRGRVARIVLAAVDVTEQCRLNADNQAQIAAISRSRASIEFTPDGTILTANANFLDTVGYTLEEVRGRHHGMFVAAPERESPAYRAFWEALGGGEFQRAEYRRLAKGGREIWLQSIYNPIRDARGKPYKVVGFATDVTAEKLRTADMMGQVSAINRSQGVIHFGMDGTILDANENFLRVIGYRMEEIRGRHHSILCDAAYAKTDDYRRLWDDLRSGKFQAGMFRRIGKGAGEVWIQAAYNPILDMNGRPFKIVKYATDVSDRMAAQLRVASASERTLENVQTVASSAEELSTSIREIAQSLSRSRADVDAIHDRAQAADRSTARLDCAATSMNGVVKLIRGVGEQINLLALNATIEAARAGEAGRGFAVVAGEVKLLSQQVTNATGRIAEDIQTMQEISGDVVGSLTAMTRSITSVRDLVTGVASAVEEQSAVTQDISTNMQTAALGVSEINHSLKSLSA
ncbi:MAG: PAS domain S-box protein [Phreatobacter sp.]|nr:PAS domain S-box protein [Phreatobacter sp.]